MINCANVSPIGAWAVAPRHKRLQKLLPAMLVFLLEALRALIDVKFCILSTDKASCISCAQGS
jgi:hypothetical protein